MPYLALLIIGFMFTYPAHANNAPISILAAPPLATTYPTAPITKKTEKPRVPSPTQHVVKKQIRTILKQEPNTGLHHNTNPERTATSIPKTPHKNALNKPTTPIQLWIDNL